ncbi:MAG TPA: hypothetical protein VMU68_02495 [Acidimicrobiales bacterium]|nr:hypothetical protein [Acidimicrobiales bacterium]
MNDEQLQTMIEAVDPVRDLSDETLNELLPRDQLMSKISAGIAVDATASTREKATPLWHRIPTFVGAFVAAISVVLAGALMLFGSSPALVQGTGVGTKTTVPSPAKTLPSPVLKIEPQPVAGGVAFTNTYDFTADPSLSTAVGSATAYELTSPSDLSSVTGEIATALGVSGPVTYLGPGNYQAGPSSGPDVVVDTVSGILQWQYPDWTDQPPGVTVPVNEALPLPTDDQAMADARQLLQSIGVNAEQLGTPQLSRYPAAVNVEFPMEVDGLATDQYSQVSYGPGATVLTSMGIMTTATPSATYPTISPDQAVSLLTQSSGGSTSGEVTTNSGSDVVSVDINDAAPGLSTYVLTDGTSWLLPTWKLSGPESGTSVTNGSKYTGHVLAVGAKTTAVVSFVTPANAGSETGVTNTSTHLVIPKGKPSQINEWMAGQSGRYIATRSYSARVIYTNIGRTCALARTYIGVQAVAGRDHTPIGMGSVTPTNTFGGSITLKSGHTAAASVVIGSTSSSSFRQMLKDHDGTCAPKYANAIKVFGLYSGWPVKYFTFPVRLSICTTNFFNVSAGPIAITKKIVVHA